MDALRSELDENICDAIVEKCLNPARLQILYLNQIRTLLLALQLNIAVIKRESVPEELQQSAKKNTQIILDEIEQCIQYPAIQKLKIPIRYQRIFLVWDDKRKEKASQRGFFDEDENIPWKNKEFWKQCSYNIHKSNIDTLLDTLDEKKFNMDLQNISEEIKSLLTQVGVKRSDGNGSS